MKYILFFIFLVCYSFSVNSERYSCKYNEFETIKNITFDRVTHSHFKICNSENCYKNRFEVIFADKKNLIFGNIISKDKIESDGFQLVIIDKKTNLFSIRKISLQNNNIKNELINGKCVLN